MASCLNAFKCTIYAKDKNKIQEVRKDKMTLAKKNDTIRKRRIISKANESKYKYFIKNTN